MASSSVKEDKYRTYLHGDEEKNTKWRFGVPPNYDVVNKLFESGRTNDWPPDSLEGQVQTLVKNWEMEFFHKADINKRVQINGPKEIHLQPKWKPINLEEIKKVGGGYNPLLPTSLPEKLRPYNPDEETANSSHQVFTTTFPRGFALEILQVYCGPPVIVYKCRHWGFIDGPFKGHASTGEKVELYGWMSIQ